MGEEPLQDRLKRIFDDAGGSDTLVDLLAEFGFEGSRELADTIVAAMAENAALIEASDRLNELACHQDDCQIVTHGVWSDPIPCTCGYTEAWKKWKEVRGE